MNEGASLYFSAGGSVPVEKFDMRIGKSEFDFRIDSRRFRGGAPEPMQDGLDREFAESLMGLPVSLGNAAAMVRERRIELTSREVRPQTFRSSIATTPVAWRIWFKRNWYTGQASGRSPLGAKPTDGADASASRCGGGAPWRCQRHGRGG